MSVNGDVLIYNIFPLLCPLDIFSLFKALPGLLLFYKRKHKLAPSTNALKHVLDKRLTSALCSVYGKYNGDMFMRQMALHHLVLTGGFLLAVLNGDSVRECSDVDFMCMTNHKDWTEFEENTRKIQSVFKDFVYKDSNKTDYDNSYAVSTFRSKEPKKKFQCIWLYQGICDYKKHVDSFDLDFCANYYDWDHLVIKSGTSVRERSCTIKLHDCYGHYLHCSIPHSFIDEVVFEKKWQRICKYRKRGYHIVLEQQKIPNDFVGAQEWNKFWKCKL